MPGQVRSGHQWRIVDPISEKFAVPPELEFFYGSIYFLQVFIKGPLCAFCISHNLYICDLRSCQIRDLYVTSAYENIEMRPALSKREKTPNYFRIISDYLIRDDTCVIY